jgi:hypothetical protein
MKTLKTSAVCTLLTLCFLSSFGQKIPINEPDYNKPTLFHDLPVKFNLDLPMYDRILDLSVGKHVALPLAGTAAFQGVIVSKSNPGEKGYKSIVVRSTNREGAILSFTRINEKFGNHKYTGRIISRNNSDALEIESENGKYVMKKMHYYDLINE